MQAGALQQLGVLFLAILFSVLFTYTNDRKARKEKARLDEMKE